MTTAEQAVRAVHEIAVRAPARETYRLLADLDNWPWIFKPFVHVERTGQEGEFERLGMWTTGGDRVERWGALRRLDEAALRIEFRPEDVPPPLTGMERVWAVEPDGEHACLVRLLHTYTLAEDTPAARAQVAGVIDTVAGTETQAVREAAELTAHTPELRLVVTDTVGIEAEPRTVGDILYDITSWPRFLPHVARAEALQDADGLQFVEVDTVEGNGSLLAMRTARVRTSARSLAYKQLVLPPIGSSHHVRWHVSGRDGGAVVRSEQTVVIKQDGIEAMLGDGKVLADATEFIRRELSAKVRLILDGAKRRAEGA
ncbi:aromatase/cyclase [Streptomyces cavernicola]|uniref:SRPBCC family protein n=1 Tax=Streptomyces cavernicola TaxID=3043613 RepID=A0ABT6SJ24_9ACTN|nr:SRPBCC family protein [Streptomyces sp. B-S-A6]MDI3408197.1 SRPBCC family protein [Streptomyces sp. B-S-A6]